MIAGSTRQRLFSVAAIVLLGLAFYLPGLDWGLPAITSWSQDTIAGARSLGPVENWPREWRGRYAPLHYLINVAAYQPLHASWIARGLAQRNEATGRVQLRPDAALRVADRYVVSRAITVVMAILAGIGTWAAALRLSQDWVAALAASVVLMTGATFTYFAHLGNVDVPSIFWLSWSVFAYVCALERPTAGRCAALGLLAAAAVCTKDGVAGVYPGIAIMLAWSVGRGRASEDGSTRSAALRGSLLRWPWLVGLIAFALPYLYINGVFHDPGGFAARMTYWLDDSADTLHAAQYRYPDQLRLAAASLWYAGGAVGWPMLACILVSSVAMIVRDRWKACILLVPAAAYYVIIIAGTLHFVYSRFLLPPLLLGGIAAGMALARWWRSPRPPWLRAGLPLAILLPTLGYAAGVDLEMRHDSRYACERWFDANVERPSSVMVISDWQYLPRLREMGYAAADDSFAWRELPQYVVITHYTTEDFDAERQRGLDELISGRAGFELVARFGGWRYLGAGGHWISAAGWGTLPPGKISPRLTVLKQREAPTPVSPTPPD